MGLSNHDYLLQSVTTLFYGTGLLLLGGLLILRCQGTLRRWKSGGHHQGALKALSFVVAVLGIVALIVAAASSFVPSMTAFPGHAIIATGFLLLTCRWLLLGKTAPRTMDPPHRLEGPWELRWIPRLKGMLLAAGVLLSLWALLLTFAQWTGRLSAQGAVSQLRTGPRAVLYSERRLAVNAPGVSELTSGDPTDAYRFMYEGLVMLWHSEDRYFFLPARDPTHGTVFVVPDTASTRVDFRSG